jgi:lysozyme family protein
MPALTPDLKTEYDRLFNGCVIKPTLYNIVDQSVATINASRPRYESVGSAYGVPWYFVGIVHHLEGGSKFTTHLHNGDPLTARTVNVPAKRPAAGDPPFTWETSAKDALVWQGLDQWKDWSVSGILYQLERYNGFGYRKYKINTPYLWSFSNQYSKGKFVADNKFNPDAVSKQTGAAVILRRMSEQQIAIIGELDTLSRIKALAPTVAYAPAKVDDRAKELQTLLNHVGLTVRVDGQAGQRTSDAVFSLIGKYLQGDPRIR